MLCNSLVPKDIPTSIRIGKRRMMRVSERVKNSKETKQREQTPGLPFHVIL